MSLTYRDATTFRVEERLTDAMIVAVPRWEAYAHELQRRMVADLAVAVERHVAQAAARVRWMPHVRVCLHPTVMHRRQETVARVLHLEVSREVVLVRAWTRRRLLARLGDERVRYPTEHGPLTTRVIRDGWLDLGPWRQAARAMREALRQRGRRLRRWLVKGPVREPLRGEEGGGQHG